MHLYSCEELVTHVGVRLSSDTAVWGQVTHTLVSKPSISLGYQARLGRNVPPVCWFYLLVGLGVWDETGRLP